MAKSVDLTKRVVASTPTPPVKVKRPEPPQLRTPPPAQAPAMPIKPGTFFAGSGQTGVVPPELARQVAAVRQEIREDMLNPPSVVDPNTPDLVLETVDIESLAPDQRAQVSRVIEDSLAAAEQHTSPGAVPSVASILRRPPPRSVQNQAVPGYVPPVGTPAPVLPNPQAFPEVGREAAPGWEVDFTPPEPKQPPAEPIRPVDEAKAPPAEPKEEEDEPSTVSDTPERCEHCGWESGRPDIPEPEYGEKQAFLHSILGQKPFEKDYTLLGGALRVRFRTLTTREVDVIYRQVFLEKERGNIPTPEDFWEWVNRYRMYLQILRVEAQTFLHDLPNGYDEQTNPHATAYYTLPVTEDPRETGLPVIADFLEQEVLSSESVQRIVNNTCARFNRLVAKLEAMVDNSDFWKPTGAQS